MVPFTKLLSPQQEEELIEDWKDGVWSINDLSVIYRVSTRTVYRVLARNNVPRKNRVTKPKRRKPPKPKKALKPCGTNAAYQRHRRNNEYPCPPCLAAHAANVSEAKERNKDER
jgi:hypothetical protein